MSLRVIWSEQARAALFRVHWETAARIDRAVISFASSLGQRAGEPHVRLMLRVAGHEAILMLDRNAAELTVVWLYKARQ